MEQALCLDTLQRIEERLSTLQAMVVARRPREELLSELFAARSALNLVEAQVKDLARQDG